MVCGNFLYFSLSITVYFIHYCRITPGDNGSPGKSTGKEGIPTITEQDEEDNGQGEGVREEITTPDKERPQEQVEEGSILFVDPQLGEQEQPTEEEGEPIFREEKINIDC